MIPRKLAILIYWCQKYFWTILFCVALAISINIKLISFYTNNNKTNYIAIFGIILLIISIFGHLIFPIILNKHCCHIYFFKCIKCKHCKQSFLMQQLITQPNLVIDYINKTHNNAYSTHINTNTEDLISEFLDNYDEKLDNIELELMDYTNSNNNINNNISNIALSDIEIAETVASNSPIMGSVSSDNDNIDIIVREKGISLVTVKEHFNYDSDINKKPRGSSIGSIASSVSFEPRKINKNDKIEICTVCQKLKYGKQNAKGLFVCYNCNETFL